MEKIMLGKQTKKFLSSKQYFFLRLMLCKCCVGAA